MYIIVPYSPVKNNNISSVLRKIAVILLPSKKNKHALAAIKNQLIYV